MRVEERRVSWEILDAWLETPYSGTEDESLRATGTRRAGPAASTSSNATSRNPPKRRVT